MSEKLYGQHPVELPISEEIRQKVDADIKGRDPVSDDSKALLRASNLKMYFPVTKGLLKKKVGDVKAVDDVSFFVQRGQTLGIVGESGSGKSTVGNCVLGDLKLTSGQIIYDGHDLSQISDSEMRHLRKDLTCITQDPFASLNPRMTVEESILEGPKIHGVGGSRQEQRELAERLLTLVGLNPKVAERFPHEFSGGQRQRISIARALAMNPKFIVCDEIVSALDVSIQAQIVNLMAKLQQELNVAYIFIGHDLSVVRQISHKVAVMYLGKFMELTDSDELYTNPLHPYTQALISAAPIPNPTVDQMRKRILLKGDIPSPMNPPKGCNFCTRCPYAEKRCFEEEPEYINVGTGEKPHFVACHQVTGK
jgi:oligopeptide/dipeptide ABC transporter ATP-binding protein